MSLYPGCISDKKRSIGHVLHDLCHLLSVGVRVRGGGGKREGGVRGRDERCSQFTDYTQFGAWPD